MCHHTKLFILALLNTKTKIMANKLLLVLIAITVFASNAYSQTSNYGKISFNEAVNISGKQRMLSQKMSKAYLMLVIKADGSTKKELEDSKNLFDEQLAVLKDNTNNPSTKTYIDKVTNLWGNFKTLISQLPANTKNAKSIMDLNTALLAACNDLVTNIESSSSKSLGDKEQKLLRIINKSGKQRMLSQRLALYYTASLVFPESKLSYRNTLNTIFLEYDDVISLLSICDFNNEAAEKELELIMKKWDKYQVDKEGFFSGDFAPDEVNKTSNQLTYCFNKITEVYTAITF